MLGNLSCLHFKGFFDALLTFSAAIFVNSPFYHCNCRALGFYIVTSKFPKMLDEDSISRIRGSCNDCDLGERWKLWPQKSNRRFWFFFGLIFVTHQGFCDYFDGGGGGGVCRWLGDENLDRKNWTNVFNFFGRDFRHPISHINSFENLFSIFSVAIFITQFPPIAIAGPSNSWYCVFIYQFWELNIFKNVWRRLNIANLRVLQLWWGGGMTKIAAQKNQRLRSWPDFLWRLPTFSRTGWRSRSASFEAIKPLSLSSAPAFSKSC